MHIRPPHNFFSMNGSKTMRSVLLVLSVSVIVLGGLLFVPLRGERIFFEIPPPRMFDPSPDALRTQTILLSSGHTVRQRVWLPALPLQRIGLWVQEMENFPTPSFRLYKDVGGTRGT